VQEGDALAFGTEARCVIDETNAPRTAPGERPVEVINGEADVMDPRATFGDELADRRLG
jgi:hypothetical protein